MLHLSFDERSPPEKITSQNVRRAQPADFCATAVIKPATCRFCARTKCVVKPQHVIGQSLSPHQPSSLLLPSPTRLSVGTRSSRAAPRLCLAILPRTPPSPMLVIYKFPCPPGYAGKLPFICMSTGLPPLREKRMHFPYSDLSTIPEDEQEIQHGDKCSLNNKKFTDMGHIVSNECMSVKFSVLTLVPSIGTAHRRRQGEPGYQCTAGGAI